MKIAIDAMGGDFGPAVVVEGAVSACREFNLASVLVGDRTAIEREIIRLKAQDLPITLRHASQVVGMAESPSQALRRKRDSSLRVAAELVKEGECNALVSACCRSARKRARAMSSPRRPSKSCAAPR